VIERFGAFVKLVEIQANRNITAVSGKKHIRMQKARTNVSLHIYI